MDEAIRSGRVPTAMFWTSIRAICAVPSEISSESVTRASCAANRADGSGTNARDSNGPRGCVAGSRTRKSGSNRDPSRVKRSGTSNGPSGCWGRNGPLDMDPDIGAGQDSSAPSVSSAGPGLVSPAGSAGTSTGRATGLAGGSRTRTIRAWGRGDTAGASDQEGAGKMAQAKRSDRPLARRLNRTFPGCDQSLVQPYPVLPR